MKTIYIGLSIDGCEMDEYCFTIHDATCNALINEYKNVVETGKISGADFYKYLEEKNSELAKEIFKAFMHTLLQDCMNNDEGTDIFPYYHLEYDLYEKTVEENPHLHYIAGIQLYGNYNFNFDFTDFVEYIEESSLDESCSFDPPESINSLINDPNVYVYRKFANT